MYKTDSIPSLQSSSLVNDSSNLSFLSENIDVSTHVGNRGASPARRSLHYHSHSWPRQLHTGRTAQGLRGRRVSVAVAETASRQQVKADTGPLVHLDCAAQLSRAWRACL
ncbi:hypothetical protein MRX96_035218 [Rhipicephalus microplus]